MMDETLNTPEAESDSPQIETIDASDAYDLTKSEETHSEPEEDPATSNDSVEINELDALKNEISELRRQLDERKNHFERMSREVGEFSSLFPEKALSEIPDSVWNEVRAGIPLAASYALYEKKTEAQKALAERVNSKNKECSTGAIGRTAVDGFFTPDEVRAMSREEIKKHYPKIIESMKKWN